MQRRAGRDGQPVPEDLGDFVDKAQIYFLDEHGEPINFDRVVIAWEHP